MAFFIPPNAASMTSQNCEDAKPLHFLPRCANQPPGVTWKALRLTLHRLAAALSGESQTMKGACLSFGIHLDADSCQLLHEVTIDSIRTLHSETAALQSLTDALIEEHSKYSIPLSVTQTYTSASIAKAHLKAMGIPPICIGSRNFRMNILVMEPRDSSAVGPESQSRTCMYRLWRWTSLAIMQPQAVLRA